MEETEKAVLCLYSQASDPGIRKQANQYCESLRQQARPSRSVRRPLGTAGALWECLSFADTVPVLIHFLSL